MAVNIQFYQKSITRLCLGVHRLLAGVFLFLILDLLSTPLHSINTVLMQAEPVQACVLEPTLPDSDASRLAYAQCLGWQANPGTNICQGAYLELPIKPLNDPEAIQLQADKVSFYRQGRSTLQGNVSVQQNERVLNAQTAYVYRDPRTNEVTRIELLNNVRYLEPGRLMVARKVTINAKDKAGVAEDVIYRFQTNHQSAILPAWGRAHLIERFANQDYYLNKATYSTCAPSDRAWEIQAEQINLDEKNKTGVARNAKLLLGRIPVFYSPYLSFPTSRERKSGFLMPTKGYSNVGGFDFSIPYYWNIAPNYDATFIPHLYSHRGLMMGGQFRYLTDNSTGVVNGRFLPHDHAFANFLHNNILQYPELGDISTDRWSVQYNDITRLMPNLNLRVNYQQVSDDYYLQDFSSNLAVLTERQLLREGELDYSTQHWLFRSLVQSYQTLQPVNQTPVSDIYQRLPQFTANGLYDDLLFNGNLNLLAQFDNFSWPNSLSYQPEGPRYFLNPILSFPQMRPWGYLTPSFEIVQKNYDVHHYFGPDGQSFSDTIPRAYLDGGLYFDRYTQFFGQGFNQTLEPRLFYLYVPYRNQIAEPVYDSAYMIFTTDQLFRTNRFSGFDRIGDTNQLSYALTTRLLSETSGIERASLSIGQIAYFAHRKLPLCQSITGQCPDSTYVLGYLSPNSDFSPIATRASYRFLPKWSLTGDYVFDPTPAATNNGHLDLRYQADVNQILSIGYTYLVNGDIVQVSEVPLQRNSLHQASFSYAWPFSDHWSSLGAINYNLSKNYQMMSFLGVQYDSCCWAMRLLGGRAFRSLNDRAIPQYNNSIYLQILLKGLGSVGNSDPSTTIHTFIPGYLDRFHH